MKSRLENVFVHLLIIFTVLVFLSEFGIYKAPLNFFYFALALAFFSIFIKNYEHRAEKTVKHAGIIILALVIFSFALKVFFVNDYPPGYDTGFYKYGIERYSFDVSDAGMPEWIKAMYPQGLFVLLAVLGSVTGIGSEGMLLYMFPFFCAMLILPVFVVTRHYFDERSAIMASIVYVLSYTQYHAFLMMYFKNVLGLILLLYGVYFLDKKKYVLLLLVFSALGAYHRPEFLLLGILIGVFVFLRRDTRLLGAMVFSFALVYPFWAERLDIYLPMVFNIAKETISGDGGGGTFYSLFRYKFLASAYMPFALIGAVYAFKKKLTPLNVLLFINGAIVVFELFFFKRLIINLDLLLIIFAGAGISAVFLQYEKIPKYAGYAAVAVLFLVLFSVTAGNMYKFQPTLDEGSLDDIRNFDAPYGSSIVVPSTEAPWVRGYVDFDMNYNVISPGLFSGDGTFEEWGVFRDSASPEYLDRFPKPLYVFHKENFGNQEKFSPGCFVAVNPSFDEYVC